MSRKSDVRMKLKHVMLEMMDEMPFDRITVKEICSRANASRVTFYTWYDDKYDLLEDYFTDLQQTASGDFDELQKKNNPENSALKSFENLLDCIMNLYRSSYAFFKHMGRGRDEEIFSRCSRKILQYFELFTDEYMNELHPVFGSRETSAFLCSGLWKFADAEITQGKPSGQIRKDAGKLLAILLHSDLFPGEKRNAEKSAAKAE